MFKGVLALVLFIGVTVGLAEYLKKQDIERMKVEKDMRIELAKIDVERIKAATAMYYAQAKLNQSHSS